MQHPSKDAEVLRGLTAVDGSLLPALPKMAGTLWVDDLHRAAKLHLHFDVFKGVPVYATVSDGNGNEKKQLRTALQPDRLYVIDRGYAEYQLFQDIIDARSHFISRSRLWTGNKATKRVFEMLCHDFSGWASEAELLALRRRLEEAKKGRA